MAAIGIGGLIIDRRHQRRGYGRAAVLELLEVEHRRRPRSRDFGSRKFAIGDTLRSERRRGGGLGDGHVRGEHNPGKDAAEGGSKQHPAGRAGSLAGACVDGRRADGRRDRRHVRAAPAPRSSSRFERWSVGAAARRWSAACQRSGADGGAVGEVLAGPHCCASAASQDLGRVLVAGACLDRPVLGACRVDRRSRCGWRASTACWSTTAWHRRRCGWLIRCSWARCRPRCWWAARARRPHRVRRPRAGGCRQGGLAAGTLIVGLPRVQPQMRVVRCRGMPAPRS
jgi:hypothetical protein